MSRMTAKLRPDGFSASAMYAREFTATAEGQALLRRLAVPGAGLAALLFALPGNPVAALVTFHAFARDALLALLETAEAKA